MRISILGGGPAGLYLGLLVKKHRPDHEVSIVERNPADATYGWGVVFSDRTLGSFREADYPSFVEITDELVIWDAIDIRYRDSVVRCGGQTFSGISRKRLLQILQDRCRQVGVEMTFEQEVDDLSRFGGSDLVVAADGVNGITRTLYADAFDPRLREGRSKFVWFGTTVPFDAFTFIFRENEHGLFQVHAYPFDGTTSTFIVECTARTWNRAGLAEASEQESLAFCESLFAQDLRGHRLLSNRSLWLSFITIRCRTWRHRNVVLVGDAAHTAHFSIGSGTKLAMEDAIALADGLARHDDLGRALADYQAERKPAVERLQQAAAESQAYFEGTERYQHMEPHQFAFHLLSRSGRMGYTDLRLRDPTFMAAVDAWFSGGTSSPGDPKTSIAVAPPPALVPLQLRALRVPNRVVAAPDIVPARSDGLPGHAQLAALERAASGRVGLVITPTVAVIPEGRITPEDSGMWSDPHAQAWADIVAAVTAKWEARLMVRLGHAGRRAATRPRAAGVDRPLPDGGWTLLSASPIPAGPGMPVPRQMDREDMDEVREGFVSATRRAREAGFHALELHLAHGYLLGSFLSPASNVREDVYGGSVENRLWYPLEIVDACRKEWPEDRPLAATISATDWIPGGAGLDQAVTWARALREHGCDLIEVLAGQTTADARPRYDPYELVSYSDRVRNEARVPTLAFGPITAVDQVSTIVAAGRADLCHLLTG